MTQRLAGPDSPRIALDFWTSVYGAIDDWGARRRTDTVRFCGESVGSVTLLSVFPGVPMP